ncbi:M28 family metallopeptidase [Zunongwangia sp.]|uniref:M28 family metallopeptidase n=1 Tax=Zunongwangia sp. TaxID=1965325 RepID=UPI003AA7B1B9
MSKSIKIWLIISLCLGDIVLATAQSNTSKEQVSSLQIEKTLKYLSSDELMGRKTGTLGIEKAANYIESIFQKNHIQPYYKTYRDSFQINGVQAYNIVGYLEGNDPDLKNQFVIIGAHYDHIGTAKQVNGDTIANGANDNAAGTTGVLELAKYFAKEKINKRSLLFILFSGEELGLKGSSHSAERLKEERLDLYTMLNLEMMGVPMKDKNYLAYVTGFKESNLAEKFNGYTGEKTLGFLPEANQMNLFKRSDNYPFYKEFNVPAQTICTFDFTNYPYYHHVSDEFSELDVAHIRNVITSLIPGIKKIVSTPNQEIKLNQ